MHRSYGEVTWHDCASSPVLMVMEDSNGWRGWRELAGGRKRRRLRNMTRYSRARETVSYATGCDQSLSLSGIQFPFGGVKGLNSMAVKSCPKEPRVLRKRFLKFFLFIHFKEKTGGEKERDINVLFHLLMHSLVDSCMCPGQGSNLQSWCIRAIL